MLIDGHNDLPWAHREEFGYDLLRGDVASLQPRLHTDLPRLRAGGVKGQFWSVYVPSSLPEPEAVVATLEQIDFVHRMVARYPDNLALATTAEEIEKAVSSGRIASLIGVEGGHSLGGSLGVLRQLHRLGARYLTLTHNDNTSWADSATDEPTVGGLSDFGRQVVQEMNRLGMIVDLSHAADTTMRDAIAATSAPVMFSHSNARALCDVSRNVPDDVLATVPGNGGIVMVTFVPCLASASVARWKAEAVHLAHVGEPPPGERPDPFEAMRRHASAVPPPRATLDDVVAHLEHLREVVGLAHVGIGGDFDGDDFATLGLEDVASYPRLFDALRARRWSSADVAELAGRNVLRVLRDVETVAQ